MSQTRTLSENRNAFRTGLMALAGLLALLASPAYSAAGHPLQFPAGLDWLNVSRPLTAEDLKGKVVLLDFWTSGCVNCWDVATELRGLEERFGDRLAVIGVHSPKFDHEANLEALRHMVARLDLRHPVVNDPELQLMDYYGARAWPTVALFAPDGSWVGKVAGERHQAQLARAIDQLIKDYAGTLNAKPLPIALEKDKLARSLRAAPGKVAVSPDGNQIAVSDTLHHRILIAEADGTIHRVVGDGQNGLRDGPADRARFGGPQGLVFHGGSLLVADPGNQTIRSIALGTGDVTTLAGTGNLGAELPDTESDARTLALRSPWALAVHDDTVYVAMAGDHRIWRLGLKTGRMAPFAGSGREGIDPGPLAGASFAQPSALALVGDSLFVADPESSAVRRIRLDQGQVENIVGTGLFDFGDRDGPLAGALLQHCSGLASLGPDRLAVADTYNSRVKLIDLKAGTIRSILGTGKAGRRLASPAETELNEPGGLAVLGNRLLVADTDNDRILILDLATDRVEEWPLHLRQGGAATKSRPIRAGIFEP